MAETWRRSSPRFRKSMPRQVWRPAATGPWCGAGCAAGGTCRPSTRCARISTATGKGCTRPRASRDHPARAAGDDPPKEAVEARKAVGRVSARPCPGRPSGCRRAPPAFPRRPRRFGQRAGDAGRRQAPVRRRRRGHNRRLQSLPRRGLGSETRCSLTAPTCRQPPPNRRLSSVRRTLPAALFGRASTKWMRRGRLWRATRSAQASKIS